MPVEKMIKASELGVNATAKNDRNNDNSGNMTAITCFHKAIEANPGTNLFLRRACL